MLSRRNIRIKALQQLYAFTQQEADSLPQFKKQLENRFKEMFQFNYFILKFMDDFNVYLESEKDIELAKYFPNKNFIRSTEVFKKLDFFKALEDSEEFVALAAKLPFSWKKHGEVFNRIFTDLVQYDFFIDFNVFDTPDAGQQKEFMTHLYEYLFNECELFESTMEEEYTAWDDDNADILKAVIKMIDTFYSSDKMRFEQISSKQKEDIDFGLLLFEKCIVYREMLDEMIQKNAPNWDPERLTVTDMLMLRMALAEFLYFETIPPKVSINEYLDIAKMYSTPKSHLFINGVLDKLRITLTENGKIQKSGRGLIN